jgi:hypothetical protein
VPRTSSAAATRIGGSTSDGSSFFRNDIGALDEVLAVAVVLVKMLSCTPSDGDDDSSAIALGEAGAALLTEETIAAPWAALWTPRRDSVVEKVIYISCACLVVAATLFAAEACSPPAVAAVVLDGLGLWR